MKVWGVYDDEIRELAAGVGLKIFCDRIKRIGLAYQFRLALGERREDGTFLFQKFGHNGQRTSIVCWHGYRAFLMSLFGRFPEARVKTGLGDFYGRENFLENYKYTRGIHHRYEELADTRGCVCHPEPMRQIERPPFWDDWLRQAQITYQPQPIDYNTVLSSGTTANTDITWNPWPPNITTEDQ